MSKRFVIDKQNSKILDLLEHDELSVLIKAICGYINNDEFDIINPKIEAIYNVLKIQMDNEVEAPKVQPKETVKKQLLPSVKKGKVKTENIPSFEEVYLYLQFIPEYKNKAELLKFSLKAKYDSWIENKWRDGYNKDIKNWKIKIRQILPHLKEIHNGSTKIEQKQISISDSRRSYTEKVLGINGNENKNEGVSSFEETDYTDVSLF